MPLYNHLLIHPQMSQLFLGIGMYQNSRNIMSSQIPSCSGLEGSHTIRRWIQELARSVMGTRKRMRKVVCEMTQCLVALVALPSQPEFSSQSLCEEESLPHLTPTLGYFTQFNPIVKLVSLSESQHRHSSCTGTQAISQWFWWAYEFSQDS